MIQQGASAACKLLWATINNASKEITHRSMSIPDWQIYSTIKVLLPIKPWVVSFKRFLVLPYDGIHDISFDRTRTSVWSYLHIIMVQIWQLWRNTEAEEVCLQLNGPTHFSIIWPFRGMQLTVSLTLTGSMLCKLTINMFCMVDLHLPLQSVEELFIIPFTPNRDSGKGQMISPGNVEPKRSVRWKGIRNFKIWG